MIMQQIPILQFVAFFDINCVGPWVQKLVHRMPLRKERKSKSRLRCVKMLTNQINSCELIVNGMELGERVDRYFVFLSWGYCIRNTQLIAIQDAQPKATFLDISSITWLWYLVLIFSPSLKMQKTLTLCLRTIKLTLIGYNMIFVSIRNNIILYQNSFGLLNTRIKIHDYQCKPAADYRRKLNRTMKLLICKTT